MVLCKAVVPNWWPAGPAVGVHDEKSFFFSLFIFSVKCLTTDISANPSLYCVFSFNVGFLPTFSEKKFLIHLKHITTI